MNPLLRLCSYSIGAIFTALGVSIVVAGPERAAALYVFLLAAPFLAVGHIGGRPLPSVAQAEQEDRRWGVPAVSLFVIYMVSGGVTLLLERFALARPSVIHVWKGIAHVSGTLTIVLVFLTALYSTRLAQARKRDEERGDGEGG